MKCKKYILVVVVLLWAVGMMAQKKGGAQRQSDVQSVTDVQDGTNLQAETAKEKAYAFFMEGLRLFHQEKHAEAYDLFHHALALDSQLVGAYYKLSNYEHFLHNDSASVGMLEQASRLDDDNYWVRQALVALYVNKNRDEDAIAELERLSKKFPRKTDVLWMLGELYNKKQDYANVVKTLDRVELLEGKSEELSMQKFRNYVQMKDEKKAYAEMTELAEEYPNDVRYQVLIGDLYADNGKLDKAYAVYKEIEKEHPDNLALQLSFANYYQMKGEDSLYQDAMEQLIVNTQLDDDTRVRFLQGICLQSIQENSDTTQVLPLLRKLLTYPQKDTRVAELCARYMITRDAPKESVKPVLWQMLDIDPEQELARNQLLSYAIQEDDTMEVVRLCKTAVDYNSSDPVYYYYLGIGYYQLKKNKDAVDALQKGLGKVTDKSNLSLITNMYAVSGDLYHQLGNDKKAFECYDSCLLYRPDDALVLNNYAYYLSEQKKDLARAEEMSKRSLEKEANNPTYLDTYAWILFQQKRYEEARVTIDSVLVLLGDSVSAADANLVEHAGDIYMKCGQKERALELWNQAKQLGTDSATIDDKIRKKKYIDY